MLLYDPGVAVGVLIDALDGRSCDLCDLLRKLGEEAAFPDVLLGDLVLRVQAAQILKSKLYPAHVPSMGFQLF